MRQKLEALERRLASMPKLPVVDATLKDVIALIRFMIEQIESLSRRPPAVRSTAEIRLNAACRVAALVRRNIENAGGLYNGSMVPNLQTIIDLGVIPDSALPTDLEAELQKLERGEK